MEINRINVIHVLKNGKHDWVVFDPQETKQKLRNEGVDCDVPEDLSNRGHNRRVLNPARCSLIVPLNRKITELLYL